MKSPLFNTIKDPMTDKSYKVSSKEGKQILCKYLGHSPLRMDYSLEYISICHQPSKPKHYIFGYGSLILKESRCNTIPTGLCYPVYMQGFQRSWSVPIKYNSKRYYTALGLYKTRSFNKINGVLTEINPSDLKDLDKREMHYNRIAVPIHKISPYPSNTTYQSISKNSKIWVYVNKTNYSRRKLPTPIYPIVQSYLDLALLGSLRISTAFVKDFITSTSGWTNSKYKSVWLNDRKKPLRLNCSKSKDRFDTIDKVLKSIIPEKFSQRK